MSRSAKRQKVRRLPYVRAAIFLPRHFSSNSADLNPPLPPVEAGMGRGVLANIDTGGE